MENLKNELINASRIGNFLQVVYEKSFGESGNRRAIEEELISLHNDGLIDAIGCFSLLEKKTNVGYRFFQTRRIFEKILPYLNAPVKSVMECVIRLVREAGRDMAAGSTIEPFIDFCSTESSRPKESLSLIEAATEQLFDLLSPTIVSGTRIDIRHYLDEAIRLTSHENIEVRRRAIFSLGRIQYSQDIKLCDSAIACLELAVTKENDDHLLGNLINSAFNLFRLDNSYELRIIGLINDALSQGGDCSLHAASEILGYSELPDALLDSLLNYLRLVKPQNKGTLDNIDYGLSKLINRDDPTKGIEFLEAILTDNSDEISIDIFVNVIEEIHENENVLNKLMTRWFLRGDRILCDVIWAVVKKSHDHNMLLKIDPSELIFKDQLHIVFIARKSIGYLFFKPVTAASVIISLMHNTNEDETLNQLGELLINPLLLNFPGKVKDFLVQKSKKELGKTKETIETALETIDEYLNNLRSIGVIPELHPTQTQIDAYRRHSSQLMSESLRKAEKKSVLLPLVSKSALLYGRKSIDYVYDSNGKSNRIETPLHSHVIEMEVPQLINIDNFGLDYMIKIFKAEYIKA